MSRSFRDWSALLGLASICCIQTGFAAEPATAQCGAAVGEWNWFLGGKVSLAAGGQARWTPAVATMPPATATWRCDAANGTYIVTWQNGFVDTLRLSEDGSKLNGKSSTGVAVSGVRSGAAGALPAPIAGGATAPSSTTPSGQGSQTASQRPTGTGRNMGVIVPAGQKGGWVTKRGCPQKGPKKPDC